MNLLISIDPGKSGGIAVMWPGGRIFTYSMPESESCLHEQLLSVVTQAENEDWTVQAVLERVGGYIGKGQPGSSAFVFGRGVGVVVGLLLGLGISFREVTPQSWQKLVGAGTTNGRTKTQWKRHLVDLAKKRHPDVTGITLKTADAVLMLETFKN